MPQRRPTSDSNWSDPAILTGLFVLLGFVLVRVIHLGYLTKLLQAAQSVVQKVHVVSARSLNFIAQTEQKGDQIIIRTHRGDVPCVGFG
jgi:hypothetical protein